MTTLTYDDAYLKAYVTTEVEDRARSDVDAAGRFADYWRDRLTVLRAYVITCLNKQAQPDDLFAAKLKNYQAEFDRVLRQASDASGQAVPKGLKTLTIPIERG